MARGINERSEVVKVRRRPSDPQAGWMMVTKRDVEVVEWVYQARLATREQVQRLWFTEAGRSRCQLRLTLLVRAKFLDKLPRRSPSDPDVYYLSGHATRGLRLLRTLHPEEEITPHRISPYTVAHTLDIASVRIALVRAGRAVGYSLVTWQSEAQLTPQLVQAGILPDAYIQVERPTAEGPKKASFFLEVERSGKADRALEEKLRRLGHFFYDGEYERRFGARALRVLWLIGDEYGIQPERQIAKLMQLGERLEVSCLRFAPLASLLELPPEQLWFAPIWRQPGEDGLVSLFPRPHPAT